MDYSPPDSSVHEFSRQEHWSRLPFPSPRIFLTQGSNLGPLHCRQILYLKVQIVKAMVVPVVMYGCDSWVIKKTECQRIDAFEL